MRKWLIEAVAGLAVMLGASSTATAGVIDFTDLTGGPGGTSLVRVIGGTGDGVGVTATFDNPFTEQAIDNLYFDNGLVLGSGGLTISWDVTFSATVSLTEIALGGPIIVNRGFNVAGPGVAESDVLASAGAGNHVLDVPLLFLANETYTFSSVSRNITDPITGPGGLRFEQWTFGAVSAVPEPAALLLLGIGLAGMGALRRKD